MRVCGLNFNPKPKQVKKESGNIAHDLSKSINPHYVLPDLLNERHVMVKDKIIDSIKSKTAHIYQQPPDSTTNPLILFTILSPLSVV